MLLEEKDGKKISFENPLKALFIVQINAVVQIYLYLAFVYDNRLERKENIKVARPSIFVGTPSIFESLTLKQIDLFCKNIITRVLRHYYDIIVWAVGINIT